MALPYNVVRGLITPDEAKDIISTRIEPVDWWYRDNKNVRRWKHRMRGYPWQWLHHRLVKPVLDFGLQQGWDVSGGWEDPVLARYEPGHFAAWHTDYIRPEDCSDTSKLRRVASRNVTILVPLQHADAGGLLELEGINHPIDLDIGDACLFSAVAQHRITEVTAGTRWSVNTVLRAENIFHQETMGQP